MFETKFGDEKFLTTEILKWGELFPYLSAMTAL